MAFVEVAANTLDDAYSIDNSLRLEDGDSPYLELAHGADGNTKTFTYSWWFKQGNITINRNFFGHSSVDDQILIKNDDRMQFSVNNSVDARFVTTQVFRDVSAWYHCVIAVDTTQSTDTNRVKIYINGTQITAFDTAEYPDQNYDFTGFNTNTNNQYIGRERGGNYFDGYMSEIYFIDGQAKAPTDFGEFNDNGVWIPKDAKDDLTFGNNGYYLEFKQTGTSQNSSGIGADTSGNDEHFAVSNLASTDVTTDTPTNNFCTVNPIGGSGSSAHWTFSEGNTQIQQNANGVWRATGSTMAVSKGKWYWEVEFDAGDMREIFVGVHDSEVSLEGTNRWVNGSTLFYNHNGGEIRQDGTDTTNDYGVLTAGDILGVALNMDDDQITLYDNGSAIVTNFSLSSSITEAMPTFMADYNDVVYKVNFGNPPFSISSGNSDANGYGNFEYAVPTNYYALCTKNLAEFG